MIFRESPPTEVLSAYPNLGLAWTALGSAGGFSGAQIWRGVAPDGRAHCLKGYPPGRTDRVRLEGRVHRWMIAARTAGLTFVPRIETAFGGRTTVEGGDRIWDLTEWMPGRADFHADPSDDRLAAAVTAVAELHRVWAGPGPVLQPAPAVARRLAALADWITLLQTGWQPRFGLADGPARESAEIAWRVLPGLVRRAVRDLEPWRSISVPTHPCLCDVWHDHVLFAGDRVTGLIDFGAAKVDHPAVDLARLLGSLVPDDRGRMSRALDAYRAVRPLSHPELVPLLDRTGTVVAAIHWLRWLDLERRPGPDLAAVARRLNGIVGRVATLVWG